MEPGDKFLAAQAAFDRKLDTHVRALLPHLSGHDRSYDFEDVKQEFMAVLWKCVLSYDPDYGAKFNTLAWRSIQNRSASMVREVTAAKRRAEGGVVSIDVEAIGIAVDEAISEYSAEDYAMAKLTACVGSLGGDDDGSEAERERSA